MEITLDKIDLQILNIIQANAKISNADLAKEVKMAPSAVLERVRKLEQKEVIKGYTTQIDPLAVKQTMLAFIFIRTSVGFACSTNAATLLAALPEVQEVHHIAGEDCFLIKVRTADSSSLMRLMRDELRKIPEVSSTKTTIVLETVKEQQQIIIPEK
ncbi:Lrp/AsnC family transcriptional regulator [Pinibacter soli]|uniref:Lrp/AsnC family transcriptional regulator n=1 Tax=Pinibacter soli TaxID=3044211 RepID=A0ABT6RD70_9BACT|nr:Lrp/AsnC family transcriptional regulator [Pinibacter soli]MDI3320523.1 Lrp/AsnC family transcriptional regulator [Pinibacter soli]